MKIFDRLADLPTDIRGGAVAIGNFDGVHLGHARIVERLISHAKQVGGKSVVFTFDPHPIHILRPELTPTPLTWTDRKVELLSDLDVDVMIIYPTDKNLLSLAPADFFSQIIRTSLDAQAIVEGPNFFFGHDRTGTIEVLATLCRHADISLEVVQPLKVDDDFVSSSRVRQCIRDGDVSQAREMLTRPYRVRGVVTHGAGRGMELGFPTANLNDIDTLLPAEGVYAGRAYAEDTIWPAAINIGPNPTFGQQTMKVETHLIGFQGSLYESRLEVDFISRLRDIHPFASPEELMRQLGRDVEAATAAVQNLTLPHPP